MKVEDYPKLNDCYRTELIPGKDLPDFQHAETREDYSCNYSEVKEQETIIKELEDVLIDCWGGNKLLLAKDWKALKARRK